MPLLPVGASAPDFDLATDGGGRLRLSDLAGRKVVLYFYPRDDTPSCTTEALDFSAMAAEFEAAGATIVGVSADTTRKHDRFKAKHGLAIPLASDPDHQAIDAYGVWQEKKLYGRLYMGIARTTYLIGADQRIVAVWSDVRVAGHVEAVLAAVRAAA